MLRWKIHGIRWRIKVFMCPHRTASMEWGDGDPFWLCDQCHAEVPDPLGEM